MKLEITKEKASHGIAGLSLLAVVAVGGYANKELQQCEAIDEERATLFDDNVRLHQELLEYQQNIGSITTMKNRIRELEAGIGTRSDEVIKNIIKEFAPESDK